MTYEIKLPQFEGPFDLLLFFIERDELDIYDIPIAKIADDFLGYLHQMHTLNIELASEFILVAATLMRIKAKMLLPRKDLNETGEEIDPRQELVDRLLEYKQFKEVVEFLRQKEAEQSLRQKRGNIREELLTIYNNFSNEAELQSLTLYRLVVAFQKVMGRLEAKTNIQEHQVETWPFSLEEEKMNLYQKVNQAGRLGFEKVFNHCKGRMQAIFAFLALLELIQMEALTLIPGEGVNNFWVEMGNGEFVLAEI